MKLKRAINNNRIGRKDSAVRKKKIYKITFLYSSYKQIHYPSLKLQDVSHLPISNSNARLLIIFFLKV